MNLSFSGKDFKQFTPSCSSHAHGLQGEWRDWGNGLPTAILVAVFDQILTAPTAHPQFLYGKARSQSILSRVCKHWRYAVHETPIGGCGSPALLVMLGSHERRAGAPEKREFCVEEESTIILPSDACMQECACLAMCRNL